MRIWPVSSVAYASTAANEIEENSSGFPLGADYAAAARTKFVRAAVAKPSSLRDSTKQHRLAFAPTPVKRVWSIPVKKITPALLVAALLCSLGVAQQVTIGTGVAVNSGTSYPAPYGNYWGGARHQYIVTAAEMTAAGAVAGYCVDLAFDVVTVGGAPLQNFTLAMGHTAVVPGSSTYAWQSGLTPVYSNALYTPVAGWNTHTFSTPFAWDGVQNVVIESCFNNLSYSANSTFNQTVGSMVTTKLYIADNTPGVCTSALDSALNNTLRPNIRLTFGAPSATDYQVNQANAYMDFDFILATPYAPAIDNKCVGGIVNACANSNGLPADVVVNLAPLVPLSGGGIQLNPGSIVNLDFTAGFMQLFGVFIPLGNAAGVCPILFGAPGGTLSVQMVVIDFAAPGFISLSQACQLNGIPSGSVTLVNADDAVYTVSLASICEPNVNFYGTSYPDISVSTNGLVSPGPAGVFFWVPSTAAAITNPGSFGVWSDWQSNANPFASIVVNGAGLFGGVDVTYTNVPYWGSATTSTFVVGLDAAGPRIDGMTGLGTNPTGTMILVSQGGGLATDAGATAFGIGGGATAAPTDMLYAIGTGSPALAGGANNLWFNFGVLGISWWGF